MKFVEDISRDLEKFDRILLLSGNKSEELLKTFFESDVLRERNRKILILSTLNRLDTQNGTCEYHRISKEEQEILISLYNMYDFSDRFLLISDNPQYGSLLNYVKTGIMTMEEVFRVVFA